MRTPLTASWKNDLDPYPSCLQLSPTALLPAPKPNSQLPVGEGDLDKFILVSPS